MNDVLIRALKTFVQAFFGVLIPELCVVLQNDFPYDYSAFAVVSLPILCASLAAGLSAAWNVIENYLRSDLDPVPDPDAGEVTSK